MKWGVVKAAAFALIGFAVAACGNNDAAKQQEQAAQPQFVRAETWDVTAEGAVTERRASELVTLIPSTTVVGYQAQVPVVANGMTTLVLKYDVAMQGGPGAVGVLSGDRSRWLHNVVLPAAERMAGEVQVPIDGDVFIVLQTTRDTATGTVFTVNDVSYSLQ